jgi:DNA-binding CsgD family transcriptional regulator
VVAGTPALTPRECEIVKAIQAGHGNKVIAHELRLTENTVKQYIHRIFTKLHFQNRTQVAVWATRALGCLLLAVGIHAQTPTLQLALDPANPNPLVITSPVGLYVQIANTPQPSAIQFSIALPGGATASAAITGAAGALGKVITCATVAQLFTCVVYKPSDATPITGLTFARVAITFASGGTIPVGLYGAFLSDPTGVSVPLTVAPALSVPVPPGIIPPPPVSVTVGPTSASLSPSQSQQFTAPVTNDVNNDGVTWLLVPQVGTITPGGLYTAPASIVASQVVTLMATSVADPTKSATAIITLVPPPTSACDLNADGKVDASDVLLEIAQILGTTACTNGDLDGDKLCTVVDLQRIINASASGGTCKVGQ